MNRAHQNILSFIAFCEFVNYYLCFHSGRSLGRDKKKLSTKPTDGAVKVEKPKPEQSGIILDLIAGML